jgi:hypothetical protein
MTVRCPECAKPIPRHALETALGVAQCPACEAVFDYAPEPAALVPRPRGLVERETASDLVLTYRWFRPQHVVLAIFATFWNGFLLVWYSLALSNLGGLGLMDLVMILFPILHVAVGVAVAYAALAGFVNRTEVRVTKASVHATHGPLPWRRPPPLPVDQVTRLFVAEHPRTHEDEGTPTWDLKAELTSGEEQIVCEGIDDLARGRYLAQRVGTWLGLHAKAVSGEVRAR